MRQMIIQCTQPSDNGKNQREKNEVHRKAESDKRLGDGLNRFIGLNWIVNPH